MNWNTRIQTRQRSFVGRRTFIKSYPSQAAAFLEIMRGETLIIPPLALILELPRTIAVCQADKENRLKISVVMPVYNGARYLAEAIESVLSQSEGDFEFLILDDGSSDETPAIIDEYARRDDRIRFFKDNVRKGAAARLNQGIAKAKAPYIARLDGDDVNMPDRFKKQLAFLEANPDVVMVGSKAMLIDPDGADLMIMGDALTHEEIDQGLIKRQGQLVFHTSVMYLKATALACGGYDESFPVAQDLDFFLRMAEAGRIENLPEPLVRYRHHFSSAGYARILEQEEAIDRAIEAARRRRSLPPIDEPTTEGDQNPRRAPRSKAGSHRIWGWWALSGGHLATARKHAVRALFGGPFDLESWRLIVCAVRGR